jgi:dihydrofolate reductase
MRKIVVQEFVTLDGVMQAPGGPEEDTAGGFTWGGWTAPYFHAADDEANEFLGKHLQATDLLLGKKTYEIFADYWPTHEEIWPGVNAATKYVVSDTPMELTWNNSRLITGDVVAAIKELKAGEGSVLKVIGSGVFAQTLFKNDLVDEMLLMIFPITLGTGKRLFAEGTIPAAFTMTEHLVARNGVIFANYERAGEVKTGTVG